MRTISHLGAMFLMLAALGCGSNGSAADAGEETIGDASTAGGDAGSSGGLGDDCERASDCEGALVCEPTVGECADSVSCTDHDECGVGAHCADGGECAQSRANSPCGDDDDCAPADDCIGGFCACEGQNFQAEILDVNMLITLDRSGSMANNVQDTERLGPDHDDSKWEIALGAIDLLLGRFGDQVSFGLQVFPHSEDAAVCTGTEDCDGFGCTQGNILVDVQGDAAEDISQALEETAPGCCTPTGHSLDALVGYEGLADPGSDNFVLLVADGAENCDGDPVAAAEALFAQDPPVRTFVVGFGTLINGNELNAIAEAGGTARDGELKYYQADDADELEARFIEIAGAALACSYELDSVPSSTDDLEVYFDGELVERDPSREDGWDYDADDNVIVFYGEACETLSSGQVSDLTITQVCGVIVD